MTIAYFTSLVLAMILGSLSCWIPALIFALIAAGIALRYEIRWVADHTRLTKYAPRPIPRSPRHLPRRG